MHIQRNTFSSQQNSFSEKHQIISGRRPLSKQTVYYNLIFLLCGCSLGSPPDPQPTIPGNFAFIQGKHLNAELQYGPLKVFKDSYSASP